MPLKFVKGILFQKIYKCFKGAWSYFSKFSFLFHVKNHLSKDVNLEFQLKQSSRLDVGSSCIAVACILLCKLYYSYHDQACFHQYLPNETLFGCKI